MKFKKMIIGSILVSFFFLVLLLSFVFRGNIFKYNDIGSMIVEPETCNFLITGTWKVKSIIFLDSEDFKENNERDDKLYITKKSISYSNISAKSLKFKFRYVNFKNYLISRAIATDKIKIDKEDVVIVSISNKLNFYQEFIVLDDNTISMIRNGKYYIFEKESDKVNINLDIKNENISKSFFNDTSFLIGLRSNNKKNVEYNTFLIRKNNKGVTFNKIDGLFINKNNRFFIVNSNTNNSIYLTDDYISLTKRKVLQQNNPIVNFLSENYISFETRDNENRNKNYELLSIKNFKDNNKLSLNDISGSDGEDAYFQTLLKLGYSNENITMSDLYNFGIKRENGQWLFKSIFNDNSSNKKTSTEVSLDIIPKVDIFFNSSKKIEKSVIKSKHSNYVDYFVSPNEDMVVVLTPDELVVYSVKDLVLSTLPISSVKIFDTKDIVSFQWKTFEHSEFTYNEFLKIKQIDIKSYA